MINEQWEYEIFFWDEKSIDNTFINFLDRHGLDGWEFVIYIDDEFINGFYFKRMVQSDAE